MGEMLHIGSDLRANLPGPRNERPSLDYMTKKFRGILVSGMAISRDQCYHQLATLCLTSSSWFQDCCQVLQACVLPGSNAVEESAHLLMITAGISVLLNVHWPRLITVPERKQCSKWSSLSHVSISDAGEIRTLSARRVVP